MPASWYCTPAFDHHSILKQAEKASNTKTSYSVATCGCVGPCIYAWWFYARYVSTQRDISATLLTKALNDKPSKKQQREIACCCYCFCCGYHNCCANPCTHPRSPQRNPHMTFHNQFRRHSRTNSGHSPEPAQEKFQNYSSSAYKSAGKRRKTDCIVYGDTAPLPCCRAKSVHACC